MLLITAFSMRTVQAVIGAAAPEALEATCTPSPSPTMEVIELFIVTPTPLLSAAVSTDTPAPTSTPEPMPKPELSPTLELTPTLEPTPTPTPTPDETALLEAVNGLSEYHRPNRMRQGEIDAILKTLPDDLDLSRKLIVLKAYSLLG